MCPDLDQAIREPRYRARQAKQARHAGQGPGRPCRPGKPGRPGRPGTPGRLGKPGKPVGQPIWTYVYACPSAGGDTDLRLCTFELRRGFGGDFGLTFMHVFAPPAIWCCVLI